MLANRRKHWRFPPDFDSSLRTDLGRGVAVDETLFEVVARLIDDAELTQLRVVQGRDGS